MVIPRSFRLLPQKLPYPRQRKQPAAETIDPGFRLAIAMLHARARKKRGLGEVDHDRDGSNHADACQFDPRPEVRRQQGREDVSDSGILALVRRGMGFSIFPRLAAFPIPEGVNIIDLPIALKRPFALVAQPETARAKAVEIVLRFLRDKRTIRQTDAFRSGSIGFDY